MAIIPQSVLVTFKESREAIDALLAHDASASSDISLAERAIQAETLEVAHIMRELKPHTMPVTGQGGFACRPEDLGKCGIEISSDRRVFVLFAARYPMAQELTADAIERDPALLQQFRERLPDFIKSYSGRHHSRLYELASEIKTLRDLGKVTVSYLKEDHSGN